MTIPVLILALGLVYLFVAAIDGPSLLASSIVVAATIVLLIVYYVDQEQR